MIGSGIAAPTAFGAFGVRQIFPDLLSGPLGLVPWISPSVLGLSANRPADASTGADSRAIPGANRLR
jgi:hypothetical protein